MNNFSDEEIERSERVINFTSGANGSRRRERAGPTKKRLIQMILIESTTTSCRPLNYHGRLAN